MLFRSRIRPTKVGQDGSRAWRVSVSEWCALIVLLVGGARAGAAASRPLVGEVRRSVAGTVPWERSVRQKFHRRQTIRKAGNVYILREKSERVSRGVGHRSLDGRGARRCDISRRIPSDWNVEKSVGGRSRKRRRTAMSNGGMASRHPRWLASCSTIRRGDLFHCLEVEFGQ